ncbi:hypothetical protein Tco_1411110 [Tanacetum coccineum]
MTFTDGTKEITFKTPYKDPERSELSSEGHDLFLSRIILSEDDYDRGCRKPSDLEDGFYRDTIKLGPEYLTEMDDEGEVTASRIRVNVPSLNLYISLNLMIFRSLLSTGNTTARGDSMMLNSDITWRTTERQWLVNIDSDLISFWIRPVNLICEHLVTLLHLELKYHFMKVVMYPVFASNEFSTVVS